MDQVQSTQQPLETEPTIEEIELDWWEPLGCKCEVDVDD